MIVAVPAIIVPRSYKGWRSGYLNYQLPGGEYGSIHGMVATVPPGTEIDLTRDGNEGSINGVVTSGCIEILKYQSPNVAVMTLYLMYNYTGDPSVLATLSHDGLFLMRGGSLLDTGREYNIVLANGSGEICIGTFARVKINAAVTFNFSGGILEVPLLVKSQRACGISIKEFGSNYDMGANDCELTKVSPAASSVKNQRTGANVLKPYAAAYLNAGETEVGLRYSWSSNVNFSGRVMVAQIWFEVPYGV